MPWVRIDEKAMDHPKIGTLPDGAFRLWVEGLAHCQRHLTDGHIGDGQLRMLRAYSPKRRASLLAAGLWDESETGVRVHDYLDWNESREHVMRVREMGRERVARLRGKSRGSNGVTAPFVAANAMGEVTGSEIPQASQARTERGNGGKPANALVADELADRAGRFVERYGELFREHRRGAKYFSKPALDFPEACQLCETWDDARLETLAIAFLTTDDKFCREGSGGIKHFASRASWCDGKLREAGL